MARQKKPAKYLNIKLDLDIYERLEEFSEAAGFSKTMVAERALTAFMDDYETKQEMLRKIEDGEAEFVEKIPEKMNHDVAALDKVDHTDTGKAGGR